MRKSLTIIPLIALISACSAEDNFEKQGQETGAAADQAIERADEQIEAAQDKVEAEAGKVSDNAQEMKQDIEQDLKKADNAVDAAAAELRK